MAKISLGKELDDLYVESQSSSRAYRDICSMNYKGFEKQIAEIIVLLGSKA